MTEVQVFPRHARDAGLCISGAKTWIEEHGFNWRDFVRNGLPASVLVATNDDLAMRTVEAARKEAENGR